ncbi:MAG: glycine cleavage system protein GcvH [Lachnospiraceae bacterium]|jgi:glycine cleavage system H protein|nr:glycine cleavage system protein GcvH [Lachnospiraceae bacterium]MCI9389109.1 glycine cleavage system protein GcvH [Lachnospiraceae bacterium]MCI9471276.1 glycine cleavage system protein GcvH [Lachnospiraceae bacterium]
MTFPADLKYTSEHVWVKVEGDTAKLGITEFAQDQLGDILFVDLPEVGATFSAGDVFTEIESSKTASEVPMPVGGEIVAVNEELDDSPENINEDAYAAWIVEVKMSDASELDALITAEAYEGGLEEA